ncbi:MAG: MBL fold metallo-hydrolase, partial [Candidatus Eisenbacteria bacterium]|nr:MBL fold metallo-hydrolase [Candidatus Eisenbacteria bacterium]
MKSIGAGLAWRVPRLLPIVRRMTKPAPPKFRDSAVVVLVRGHGVALEVFWVQRSDAVPVQPGFHAFVGGKVDAADASLPMAGLDDDLDPTARAARACAIREALEETGVLVGLHGAADAATLAEAREQLLAGSVTLPQLAQQHGWAFDASHLEFAGRWVTPSFAPVRFDTLFFLARVPEGQQASIIPGELSHGEWVKPAEALRRWERAEVTFAAPILWTLRELAAGEEGIAARLADAPRAASTPARLIELQHGVVLHAMKTRPLPPAQHTNAYFVGERDLILLDPGSGEADALAELYAVADLLESQGRRVKLIVVTHHHPDHVGGVAACRERFGVPVAGHVALSPHLKLDKVVGDGDVIELPRGHTGWSLTVLSTPGHTRDHISLWHAERRALFCGDLVPGGPGSVIIDPPDGDMGDYLSTL